MRDILVGVSGASGMPLALCLMRLLAAMPDVRTHCVVSDGARAVLRAECGADADLLTALAHTVYAAEDLGAGPASGSWWRRGSEPAAMCDQECAPVRPRRIFRAAPFGPLQNGPPCPR